MFGLFKKKPEKNIKPQIINCVICNGNYREEDIDFFASRRLSKNVCVRCAEYLKKKTNKNYKPLDLNTLKGKKRVVILSEEALKDIEPFGHKKESVHMNKIMKCKCGEILIFNDNSISKIGHQCYPLYYCPKCQKIWNAFSLEEEENPEFIEETDRIYKSWFAKFAFIEIKKWYVNDLEKKIQEFDDIISRL